MSDNHQRLEVSRITRASQRRTFDAWTDPALIVKWWGAGEVRCTAAEMDLAEGGRYRIANETPDGMTMWITGTFTRVDAPRGLAYTWAVEPITDETEDSFVEVTFEAVGADTLVTVVQTRIASREAHEMHLEGWMGCLEGLDRLLADGV